MVFKFHRQWKWHFNFFSICILKHYFRRFQKLLQLIRKNIILNLHWIKLILNCKIKSSFIDGIVDDHLVTTQTLLASSFIAHVKKREFENFYFLCMCHEILDAWIECQRSWLYLQLILLGHQFLQSYLLKLVIGKALVICGQKLWREEFWNIHITWNWLVAFEIW